MPLPHASLSAFWCSLSCNCSSATWAARTVDLTFPYRLHFRAGMLDHVPVVVYGESQPLTAVAQVALRNASLLVVSPFDAAVRR